MKLGCPFGVSAEDFLWAVGIENTFVPQARPGHRPLDEYELMDHYRQWREDLDRISSSGARALRYGIPWYRVNPAPGIFDWSWTDRVLDYMVGTLGLTPIIDLIHFGAPPWLPGHFVDASYPGRVAEYALAFAERYRDLIRHYTPLNEPAVTAAYCGRDGRWPPYLKGERGYVRVLIALALGMMRTADALRAGRPDALLIHAEDVGLELAASVDLHGMAALAQARRLLPLDLACGLVGPSHPFHDWLIARGASESELSELTARSPRWDVLGVNFYPWSNRRFARRRDGSVAVGRDRTRAGSALGPLLKLVHHRYQLPVMVTETSSDGDQARKARWMDHTVAAVRQSRADGIPVVGYTWFPVFTMVEWRYRWSRKKMTDHLLHLGLWDIEPRGGQLDRVPTPLIARYRGHVDQPEKAIGPVGPPSRLPAPGE